MGQRAFDLDDYGARLEYAEQTLRELAAIGRRDVDLFMHVDRSTRQARIELATLADDQDELRRLILGDHRRRAAVLVARMQSAETEILRRGLGLPGPRDTVDADEWNEPVAAAVVAARAIQ